MRGRASWAFAYALFPMTATTLKNIWNELSIFRVKKVNFWKNERIGSIALLANHGKLIQKFFWNFHFPGRHQRWANSGLAQTKKFWSGKKSRPKRKFGLNRWKRNWMIFRYFLIDCNSILRYICKKLDYSWNQNYNYIYNKLYLYIISL